MTCYCRNRALLSGSNAWLESIDGKRNASKMAILTKKSKIFIKAKVNFMKSCLLGQVGFMIRCILNNFIFQTRFAKNSADKNLIFLPKTTYYIIRLLNLHHYFTSNFFLEDLDYFDTVRMVSDSCLLLSKVKLIKSWNHFNVMIIWFYSTTMGLRKINIVDKIQIWTLAVWRHSP